MEPCSCPARKNSTWAKWENPRWSLTLLKTRSINIYLIICIWCGFSKVWVSIIRSYRPANKKIVWRFLTSLNKKSGSFFFSSLLTIPMIYYGLLPALKTCEKFTTQLYNLLLSLSYLVRFRHFVSCGQIWRIESVDSVHSVLCSDFFFYCLTYI